MLEEIKELWKQINHKRDFMLEVSEELDRTPNTLYTHWFARFWSIPEQEQPKVLELMKAKIEEQKTAAQC